MIYHYTKKDTFIEIINGKKFWLTSLDQMDDKNDKISGLKKLKESQTINDDEYVKLLELIKKAKYYSMSFSNKYDNEYLWKKYGDEKQGICFALDEEYFMNEIKKIVDNSRCKLDSDINAEDGGDIPLQIVNIIYDINDEDIKKRINLLNKLNCDKDSTNSQRNELSLKEMKSEFLVLMYTGHVKKYKFKDEDEVRVLYGYSVFDSMYGILKHECLKESLKTLGLDEAICDARKERMELNLSHFFNSKLIPYIYLGDNFDYSNKNFIKLLKTCLDKSNLKETKVLDKKGKIINL